MEPTTKPVTLYIIHHEGCADEPGPAPCPIEYGNVEVQVVALTGEADARYLRDQFWPGGTVEKYVALPAAQFDRLLAAESALDKVRGENATLTSLLTKFVESMTDDCACTNGGPCQFHELGGNYDSVGEFVIETRTALSRAKAGGAS